MMAPLTSSSARVSHQPTTNTSTTTSVPQQLTPTVQPAPHPHQFQQPYYGGGYFQYPVSYYYSNPGQMSGAGNVERPFGRLETYPRDARATNSSIGTPGILPSYSTTNVATERPGDRFLQNSNNSSSSIATSPSTNRDDDNQTLKMLDKGFSSK